MKFKSKNENYKSPRSDRGWFSNPFVLPVLVEVDTENTRFRVKFKLKYIDGSATKVLETQELIFTESYAPTMIENADGEPQEILEFITAGGVYDSSKIIDWGTPDFERGKNYFALESIWTGLEFKEQPLKQRAVDWILNTLKIEGVLLKENFELEE